MAELNIGKEKGLMLALDSGKLIVFGGLQRPVVMDYKNIHIKQINNVVVSPCGKFIMTASQDCVVLVFKLLHEV